MGEPIVRMSMTDGYYANGAKAAIKRGMFSRFDRKELKHLGIAFAVLTFCFLSVIGGGLLGGGGLGIFYIPNFGIAVLAVFTGFVCHELGHKFMAQKFGYRANFRMSISGLAIAIFASLFRLLVAAPGAVMVTSSWGVSKKQNGMMSLAGPAVNMAWCVFFLFAYFIIQLGDYPYLIELCYWGFLINTILAAFNLLPIKWLNLDGYKILAWDKKIYAGACVIAFAFILIFVGYLSG